MSLFNHVIGFRSKDSNKMNIATLYYISGGVLSSGFGEKWYLFCVLVLLLPIIVFSIKDIFIKRDLKSIVKILVCMIVFTFTVYIISGWEKVTEEKLTQQVISEVEKEEISEEEIVEEIPEEEFEVEEAEIQEENNKENIVYKGKTGNKYHKSDCGTLKGKGIEISYDDAINEGREACKICKP